MVKYLSYSLCLFFLSCYLLTGGLFADTVTQAEQTLSGHDAKITALAFSRYDNKILSGSYDSKAKLWDALTGTESKVFSGIDTYSLFFITTVAISPDAKEILLGASQGGLKAIEIETGTILRAYKPGQESIQSVAYTPDGTKVVIASFSYAQAPKVTVKVRLLDLETGQEVRTFEGHSAEVLSVAVSPDGNNLVTGSKDKTAKIWNLNTGEVLRTLSGHSDVVTSVAYSPDGSQVITGSNDKTAKIWDTTTGTNLQTLSGHTDVVLSVAFSADGSLAATGSFDNTAKLWDIQTGNEYRTFSGHEYGVNAITFSVTGTKVITGGGDGLIKIWDISDLVTPVSTPTPLPTKAPTNTPAVTVLPTVQPGYEGLDADGNGIIDAEDLLILQKQWHHQVPRQ